LLVEQTNAEIKYDDLPVVQAIPLQMSQLFGNLVSNALKFIKPGVKPVITITSGTATKDELQKFHLLGGEYHYITVSDNGIGFSSEKADQIFNIFQRLHGKKDFEGTGIGLAVCRKIAQNHHGAIYATAEEGEGATFHVLLPK
jgi:signal transduction histidine kinase